MDPMIWPSDVVSYTLTEPPRCWSWTSLPRCDWANTTVCEHVVDVTMKSEESNMPSNGFPRVSALNSLDRESKQTRHVSRSGLNFYFFPGRFP